MEKLENLFSFPMIINIRNNSFCQVPDYKNVLIIIYYYNYY